jgi:hypothetical protein
MNWDYLLMSSVAFRGFEEDGQSLINFNGQTPVMSRTGWLSDPTRGTGVLVRRNGSYERSAMLQLVSIILSLFCCSPSKVLCKSKASFISGCCGSCLEIEGGSTGSFEVILYNCWLKPILLFS